MQTMCRKVILDTDLGTDSDDIGALAILCNLARQGKLQIAALSVCNAQDDCAMAADIIAAWYGQNVPIGKASNYGVSANYGTYARAIAAAFPSRLKRGKIPDAVKVLRQALWQNEGILLITIGPLTNIAQLALSEADEICPLSGKQLLERVSEMYVMGGNFCQQQAEWNIAEDVSAAQTVLRSVTCPVTFVPFEAGEQILTGANFLQGNKSPMQVGYFVHNIVPRSSWDPLTVYCAAVQCVSPSQWGKISIDNNGVSFFAPDAKGNNRFVQNNFDMQAMRCKLEELMVE